MSDIKSYKYNCLIKRYSIDQTILCDKEQFIKRCTKEILYPMMLEYTITIFEPAIYYTYYLYDTYTKCDTYSMTQSKEVRYDVANYIQLHKNSSYIL